ncbi:MAG TPA: type I restriction-modification system endonuclease [Gemmatirosa sp.]
MSSSRWPVDPAPAESANFGFLRRHDPLLVRLGALAELHALQDPNSSIFKARQFAESLLQQTAARVGVDAGPEGNQLALIRALENIGMLGREVAELFHTIRKSGNSAAHRFTGTPADAVATLRLARTAGVWFHQTFGDPTFRPGPFVAPRPAPDPAAELRAQIEQLRAELADAQRAAVSADQVAVEAHATAAASAADRERAAAEAATYAARLAAATSDQDAALAMAEEMERLLTEERARTAVALATVRRDAEQAPEPAREAIRVRGRRAAATLALDEAGTRRLIDQQLRDAGWEADSETLTYRGGARPARGRNLAIAEWPTATGPADYVLFAGLTAIGVVEAKRQNRDARSALGQAARYAASFAAMDGAALAGGPWGAAPDGPYHVPFLFATNGRPFLRQLLEQSGIWFRDARQATNHPRALEGWYTPDGLLDLLALDAPGADAALAATASDYLPLRDYQHAAIRAAEQAIADGRREILLAMATGTGKTRTLLGLVYRLLKVKRFRRVLFLVDRTALGEQALEAFESVRLEGLQRFVDIYDVKALGDLRPDADTRLQVATVQGMVRRVLDVADGEVALPPDTYDCVVVDEAHRGYVLDRELGEAEFGVRNEQDFLSKYRRVLDHFDAVKIALTATPALHTTEIFGAPVYTYSYRQAVVDGWLVDHEPPTRIVTALSQDGIRWKTGEQVQVYDTARAQRELFRTPDELAFEVEDFNRKVVTESFNRVVCAELAARIDPEQPGKTLVFAATDAHADLVVRLLTEAFEARYGALPHDTVVKITAAADDPRRLLRRFKNERRPAVAVTVDLLTTGVDVPALVNLVFLRRVRSRILYEQMLGRATRLHPDLYGPGEDKDVFRLYDAVDLYAALEPHTAMTPVVASAAVSVGALVADLERAVAAGTHDAQRMLQEQLIAALRRRRRRLAGATALVDAAVGSSPSGPPADGRPGVDGLIERLRRATPAEAAAFLAARPALVDVLDRHGLGGTRLVISEHEDRLRGVEHGYGSDTAGARQRPEDYLDGFAAYLRDHLNEVPALLVVTQRPRDLTRAGLRELRLALDAAGYPEAAVRTAFRDVTNQDVAASIIGYVRRQALGDPLVPYAERVARAVDRVLARQPWTDVQRRWLKRIGQQLEKEFVVDREALDREQFRAQGGGFDRLNRVFDGRLADVVGDLQDAVWRGDPGGVRQSA